VMAGCLVAHNDTAEMGKILQQWDCREDMDRLPPTLFQAVYANFARLVFEDELGTDLTQFFMNNAYFWQERLQRMVLDGTSPWFDNVLTPNRKESMCDILHQAAVDAGKQLIALLGEDRQGWLWGKAHQITFVNPLRRTGFAASFLGSGPHPMGGSRETLYCAWFDYNKPFDVSLAASLRMVADLGDDDKVLAVIPGGVSGRTFDQHAKDQIQAFMNGDKVFWWFSDAAIREHGKNTLVLKPE
jgi:penicillin G amidase